MGNACSNDDGVVPQRQLSMKEQNSKKRLELAENRGAYRPELARHDPDIRCKDPFFYPIEEENLNQTYRTGTTKIGNFNPKHQPVGGCDLSSYTPTVYYSKSTNGKDEPTSQMAVKSAMNPMSIKAGEHLKILGDYHAPTEPATSKNPSFGPLKYSNGSTYQGQYKLGQRSGWGTEITQKGDVYSGSWLNDMKFGKGRMILADGTMYEGEWLNNNAHGNGTYIRNFDKEPIKSIYVGEFRNNLQHGKGKEILNEHGTCYIGDFVENAKHGQGEFVFQDQSKYIGEFDHDVVQGIGKYYYTDGRKYEGDFIKNMKHGYGTYQLGNGLVYTGEFIEGRREGKGKLAWPDGRIYQGGFLKSLQHGEGEFFSRQAEWQKGIWNMGERVKWIKTKPKEGEI